VIDGRITTPLPIALASKADARRLCRPGRQRPGVSSLRPFDAGLWPFTSSSLFCKRQPPAKGHAAVFAAHPLDSPPKLA
jgi:hypothetical protein